MVERVRQADDGGPDEEEREESEVGRDEQQRRSGVSIESPSSPTASWCRLRDAVRHGALPFSAVPAGIGRCRRALWHVRSADLLVEAGDDVVQRLLDILLPVDQLGDLVPGRVGLDRLAVKKQLGAGRCPEEEIGSASSSSLM